MLAEKETTAQVLLARLMRCRRAEGEKESPPLTAMSSGQLGDLLTQMLGDFAWVIPRDFSVLPFSDQRTLIKIRAQMLDFFDQEGALTRPVVMPVRLEDRLRTCVMVPPHYQAPCASVSPDKNIPLVYYIDAASTQSGSVPPALGTFLQFLTQGGRDQQTDEKARTQTATLFSPLFKQGLGVSSLSGGQEKESVALPYWVAYCSMMLVLTGSDAFLEQEALFSPSLFRHLFFPQAAEAGAAAAAAESKDEDSDEEEQKETGSEDRSVCIAFFKALPEEDRCRERLIRIIKFSLLQCDRKKSEAALQDDHSRYALEELLVRDDNVKFSLATLDPFQRVESPISLLPDQIIRVLAPLCRLDNKQPLISQLRLSAAELEDACSSWEAAIKAKIKAQPCTFSDAYKRFKKTARNAYRYSLPAMAAFLGQCVGSLFILPLARATEKRFPVVRKWVSEKGRVMRVAQYAGPIAQQMIGVVWVYSVGWYRGLVHGVVVAMSADRLRSFVVSRRVNNATMHLEACPSDMLFTAIASTGLALLTRSPRDGVSAAVGIAGSALAPKALRYLIPELQAQWEQLKRGELKDPNEVRALQEIFFLSGVSGHLVGSAIVDVGALAINPYSFFYADEESWCQAPGLF